MTFERGSRYKNLALITLTFLIRFSHSSVTVDKHSPFIQFENSITNSRIVKRSTQHDYSWVFGSWTSCSQQCGIGGEEWLHPHRGVCGKLSCCNVEEHWYQLRAVSCIENETGEAVSAQLCPQNEAPARNQTCIERSCEISSTDEFKWIEGHWGECNVDCGLGEQTQIMHCIQINGMEHSSYTTDDVCLQHVGVKPLLSRVCNGESDDCPYWAAGSWSECSVTCGFGIQTINIYCQRDPADTTQDPIVLEDSLCPVENKPQQVQTCSLDHCADGSNNKVKTSEQLEISRSVIDCKTSRFGCCQDNLTSAKGSSYFGCPDQVIAGDPCSLPSDSGSCTNYVIKWYFDTKEQVCLRFWYGGCQGNENRFDDSDICKTRCLKKDFKQVEKVPRCSGSKYGCCADGSTAANGPNNEGCTETDILGGCKGTKYGCCGDGVTAAKGKNRLGCAEIQNIRCQTSLHGCCQDKITAASGPNKEGCPEVSRQLLTGCHQSTYGCCSDSVSFAHGPNGEECPPFDQASCEQQKHAGTCKNYTLHWHFELKSKSCHRFWYGGCGGNSNKFSSKEECESKCVAATERGCSKSEYGCCPDEHTPAEGPNYQGCQKKCEDSTYGCCTDGATPAEGPHYEGCDFGSGDIPCSKAAYGCCADGITAASGPLKEGCGNTPDSENILTSVTRNTETTLVTGKCTAPASGDLCTEYLVKWRFDNLKQECVRHWWGGCKNNGNVFESQSDCEAECINTVVKVEEKCVAPASRDLCKEYSVKWRFDNQNHECIRHWWGGCKDNGNVFESQGDCEAQCMNNVVIINPEIEDPDFVNICDMPKDVGPCTEYLVRHYYDPKDRQCRIFYYGGCQGNENNFVKIEDCQKECMPWDVRPDSLTTKHALEHVTVKFPSGQVSSTSTESIRSNYPEVVCLMDSDSGICRASINRWFYDHNTGTCLKFIYGGCGGNSNNFETVEHCNNYCNSQEVCRLPRKMGPCRATFHRFFYDSGTGSCQNFIYGGCHGNLNNFVTKEACSKKCFHYRHISTQSNVEIIGGDTMPDVCQLNPEKGSCRGYNIMWYYNAARNQCTRFVYTGCDGNGNQFDSEKYCNDRCLRREDHDNSNSQQSTVRPVQTTILSIFHTKNNIYSTVTTQPGTSVDQNVINVRPGINAFLRCTLRDHEVLWYRDGLLLSSSPRFQIYNNGTLVLQRVTEDMSGIYTCRISSGNNIPQLEKFKVEVNVPLRILPGPTLISIKPGDKVFFHCHAVGSPQPQISWNRNGKVLVFSNHYSVFRNGTLIINGVQLEDAGDYECSAENGVAPPVKRIINLNIKETIGVDIQSHQGIFIEGETIHLVCKGTGYPAPQLDWMKEGNILKSDNKVTVNNGNLTIIAASIEDAGMYKCIASNGSDKMEDVTAVQIKYQNLQTKCEDTMERTKCQLIVLGRLCGLRIFANKCCQSCRMAKLL